MKDIKVGVKLGIGFGLVLLLTVILAVSNSLNLGKVIVQSDNIYASSKIVSHAQSLQESSLRYQVAPNQADVDAIKQLVTSIRQEAGAVHDSLIAAENRRLMEEISALAPEYEKAFMLLVEEEREKSALITELFAIRGTILPLALELKHELGGEPGRPRMHDGFTEALLAQRAEAQLDALNEMFFLARAYLMDSTDARMQRLEDSIPRLEQVMQHLQASLDSKLADKVDAIEKEVGHYMALMRRVPELEKIRWDSKAQQQGIYQKISASVDAVMLAQNKVRESASSTANLTGLIMALLAVVAGAVIGTLIVRQITMPLQTAVRIAQAIGNRDMTGQPSESRKDEFGVLLGALDQTRGNLRGALSEIHGFTTQLAAAAEELSVVTGQTSTGVHNQRTETEQVATAMNEMTATVQEVAQNSEEAAAAAQKADQQAHEGNRALQTALAEISRLSNEVHSSSEAIQQLNQDSDAISTVLTVINGIAEQTNLLALNAAIEAARAGEAGRGFAVVADEVRALAHRTQESTAQIESLIANLQQGSSNAVQMMEVSDNLAQNTLQLTREADEELQAITRTVSEIQAMSMQIATAAEEQSLVAEEINRSVVNVNSIADQSAAAVEQTSASASELARLGQALQSLVAQFRV